MLLLWFEVVFEIMTLTFSVVTNLPLFGGSLTLNSELRLRACRIALSTHDAFNRSQRVSNFCVSEGRRRNLAHDPRTWMHPMSDDDDDEDRTLDLLVRFFQNVFKKVSKRARKAVRSVLPLPISSHLVGFSVNGILLLAFLWILKAFLQIFRLLLFKAS